LAFTSSAPFGTRRVLLVSSRDGGATWAAPVAVSPATPGADQFLPAVAVDPHGRVDVVFDDRRDDPEHTRIALYDAWSRDGGATFRDQRVGDVLFDGAAHAPTRGPFIGDYLGVASGPDAVHPIWTDTRTGWPEIFTAAVPTG
jgi:hypothetical protein